MNIGDMQLAYRLKHRGIIVFIDGVEYGEGIGDAEITLEKLEKHLSDSVRYSTKG